MYDCYGRVQEKIKKAHKFDETVQNRQCTELEVDITGTGQDLNSSLNIEQSFLGTVLHQRSWPVVLRSDTSVCYSS
jgi:hypothetical protein